MIANICHSIKKKPTELDTIRYHMFRQNLFLKIMINKTLYLKKKTNFLNIGGKKQQITPKYHYKMDRYSLAKEEHISSYCCGYLFEILGLKTIEFLNMNE